MIRALYVDDEPDLLTVGEIFLERSGGVQVDTAHSAERALEMLETTRYDVVISDYQMPKTDGIALLKRICREYGEIPFILFTGKGREEVVIEAINNGAAFYLQKGGNPELQFAELATMIQRAASHSRMEEQLLFAQFCMQRASEEIYWIGMDGSLQYVNDAACKSLGYSREELQEMTIFDIDPDFSRERWDAAIEGIKKTGISHIRTHYVTKRGVLIPVEVVANLIGYGRKTRICTFCKKISPDTCLENAIIRENLVVDTTRNAVINSVTSARAFLKLARNHTQDPGILDYLLRSDAALSRASASLLDEQQYREIGKKQPVWQDLKKIVSEGILTSRKENVRCSIAGDGCEIYADPELPLVFRNLLQTICRIQKDSSCVTLRLEEDLTGLTIFIESPGTGVPAYEKEAIFEPGYLSISDPGLFMVREILGVTGIKIRETGESGIGIRFEINMPSGIFRKGNSGVLPGPAIREPAA
ncbi:MAG: response regulator [Methanoregulaceae archaeon]